MVLGVTGVRVCICVIVRAENECESKEMTSSYFVFGVVKFVMKMTICTIRVSNGNIYEG